MITTSDEAILITGGGGGLGEDPSISGSDSKQPYPSYLCEEAIFIVVRIRSFFTPLKK